MTAPTWHDTLPAARSIARRTDIPLRGTVENPGRRELFEMCGLIAADGTIPPDDTATYALVDPGVGPGATHPDPTNPRAFVEHGRRPDGMTTPAGLATLTPIAEQPAPKPSKAVVVKPPKPSRPPKPLAPCGEYAAVSRHRRLGEPMDDACRRAELDYGRTYSQKRRDAKKAKAAAAPTEAERLLAAGVNPEMAAYLGDKVRPTELEESA